MPLDWPKPASPIPVQVAFQGGGAKFVCLLAVAEVLEEAHNEGYIRIVRVAGTSAGSIVATLLSSGVGIQLAKRALDTGELRATAGKLGTFSKSSLLWSTVRGRQFKKFDPIIDWLKNVLKDANGRFPVTIGDVIAMRPEGSQIDLKILVTDLSRQSPVIPDHGANVLTEISHSCGIPFLFRWWSRDGLQYIDGGLCANLPTDVLKPTIQSDGEVLAVTFAASRIDPPQSIGMYLKALVDTAISVGEKRSVDWLAQSNVFAIDTTIGTLDFAEALGPGLQDKYQNTRHSAKEWLRNYVRGWINREVTLNFDPWADTSPSTRLVMNSMGAFYERSERGRYMKYERVRLTVYARCLTLNGTVPDDTWDALIVDLQFQTCEQPVHMMAMSVTEMPEGSSLDASSVSCTVSGPDGAVEATLIPAHLPSKGSNRHMLISFSVPLKPNSGPYSLSYQIRGRNVMQDLLQSGEDAIQYYPTRPKSSVDVLELVLKLPRSYPVHVKGTGADAVWENFDATTQHDQALGLVSHAIRIRDVPLPDGPDHPWMMTVHRARR